MLEYHLEKRGIKRQIHDVGLRFGGDVVHAMRTRSSEYDLDPRIHKYYLACCRKIWPLLLQEDSRKGVEMAEQFLEGKVTAQELKDYNWNTEGAAFSIAYNTEPENIEKWIQQINAIPRKRLESMLNLLGDDTVIDARYLLKRAAYFANYAMIYPSLRKAPPPVKNAIFLCPDLLRDHLPYPG